MRGFEKRPSGRMRRVVSCFRQERSEGENSADEGNAPYVSDIPFLTLFVDEECVGEIVRAYRGPNEDVAVECGL